MGNSGNNKQVTFATSQGSGGSERGGSTPVPVRESARKARGFKLRKRAAERTYGIKWPDHPNNGEEDDYRENGHRTYIANYSKGLRHNKLGEVDRESYESFLRAAKTGTFEAWEAVKVAIPERGDALKFFNPLAGLTFSLVGPDPF